MDIETKIKEYIAANLLFSGDGFPYADDASFLQEGIVDSLGIVELLAFVQSTFGIVVEQSEMTPANFDSVAALAAFVRRKLLASAGRAAPSGARQENL
jgi:acyl carrier protein